MQARLRSDGQGVFGLEQKDRATLCFKMRREEHSSETLDVKIRKGLERNPSGNRQPLHRKTLLDIQRQPLYLSSAELHLRWRFL